METLNSEEISSARRDAREFAWRHFDFHAKQRIEMFKAYVTLMTIAYAGYGFAAQSKVYILGITFSILAIVFSLIFQLFDVRVRQLIKISEAFLLKDEYLISKTILDPDIRLFRKSDLVTRMAVGSFRLTYSTLFRLLFNLNMLISGLTLVAFVVAQLK